MSERVDPNPGVETIARVCNRRISGGRWSEDICGKDARFHVIWSTQTMENAYCCMDHAREATQHFDAEVWHELGPHCGMPGALYYEDINRCLMPEDGIPVAEKAEVEVPA